MDFENVPIMHGIYEADKKCYSSPKHKKTGELRNLLLMIQLCFHFSSTGEGELSSLRILTRFPRTRGSRLDTGESSILNC